MLSTVLYIQSLSRINHYNSYTKPCLPEFGSTPMINTCSLSVYVPMRLIVMINCTEHVPVFGTHAGWYTCCSCCLSSINNNCSTVTQVVTSLLGSSCCFFRGVNVSTWLQVQLKYHVYTCFVPKF